jgi:lipoprotein-anchoring transpeptidase ErfK/SrfK
MIRLSRCVVILTFLAASVLFALSANARSNRETSWDELAKGRAAGPPVLAVVALKEQRVTIYDADGPILRAPISSGQTGLETPVGVFSILQKEAEHYSNRYDDAAMPFMERITWSGIALHAGALPGHPASHGCIRLPYGFAEHLFGLTKLGMRVVVARTDVTPAPISHPALLRPSTLSSLEISVIV